MKVRKVFRPRDVKSWYLGAGCVGGWDPRSSFWPVECKDIWVQRVSSKVVRWVWKRNGVRR